MQTSSVILKVDKGWELRLTTYTGVGKPLVSKYVFRMLIEALQAACVLKVHVDNDNVLPLKQYKQGA